MVKYVLFSLSLLSTLIGLGDCQLILKSGECEFSIHPNHYVFEAVDLRCNEDTVETMERCLDCKGLNCKYQRYEGCSVCKGFKGCGIEGCRRTVALDLSRSGDSIKADVSCSEEYKGVDFIVTQSKEPVYDVLKFVPADKVNYTLVISSKPVSNKDTVHHDGLWMSDKDRGLVNIQVYVGSRRKHDIRHFRFEPFSAIKAPRTQTTLVMRDEYGSIVAKPVDSAFAQKQSFDFEAATEVNGPILWAMVLSGDQGRLFKAARPDGRNAVQFSYVDDFNFSITGEPKGSQPADDRSSLTSGSSRRRRRSKSSSPHRRT